MELLDHRVVVRVVLEAAAGVDRAREPEPIQLAHEVARGVLLVGGRELGPLREGRVENRRIGLRDQEPSRVATLVALDLAAGGVGRVLRVAGGAQGGAVQQREPIQIEDEDGGLGGGGVDLGERREAPLGELPLVPAADHAYPLRGRRALGLRPKAREGVGQGGDAVPAQLEVVVQAAADRVDVRVVEPGDGEAAAEVDDACRGPALRHRVALAPHRAEAAALDGDRLGACREPLARGEAAASQHEVGGHRLNPAGRRAGRGSPARGAVSPSACEAPGSSFVVKLGMRPPRSDLQHLQEFTEEPGSARSLVARAGA